MTLRERETKERRKKGIMISKGIHGKGEIDGQREWKKEVTRLKGKGKKREGVFGNIGRGDRLSR